MKLGWFSLVLVVVTIMHRKFIEARENVFVSEYGISGEDFYVDFMRKHKVLVVKSKSREVTTLFDQTELLKKEFYDVIVQSHHLDNDENRQESLSLVFSARDAVRFTYDITKGSEVMQRSVAMPSMLMSCRRLFERFKECGKVTLTGSIHGKATWLKPSFHQHSILALIKGNSMLDIKGNPSVHLNRGDLVYIPPDSDVTIDCTDDVVYFNFSWSRSCNGDLNLDCKRESLHSLTQNADDICTICRDNKLTDRFLNTGFSIPPIGFGTARLFEKTYEMVKVALKIGYTMIDTANIYSGEVQKRKFAISSEQEVGRALMDSGVNRSDVFLVTKIDPDFMTYDGTLTKVKQSMKDLQTDYLDAVLVHDFVTTDSCGPNEVDCNSSPWIAWRGLEEMQSRGVVRSIGVSNINEKDLAYLITEFANSKVSLVQNWFDPFHQEREVRRICSANAIGFMGYSTLGKVWTDELDYDINPVLNHDDIVTFSSNNKLPATSSVLRWAMMSDVIVIPSSRNPEHVEQNFLTRSQGVDESETEVLDDLDNTFGNPENPGWTKSEFSQHFLLGQTSNANHKTKNPSKDEL